MDNKHKLFIIPDMSDYKKGKKVGVFQVSYFIYAVTFFLDGGFSKIVIRQLVFFFYFLNENPHDG